MTNKEKALTKMGFDLEKPTVYIVVGGSTFEIKDQLKSAGARFNPAFGWYFMKEAEVPEGFSLAAVDFYLLYEYFETRKFFTVKADAKAFVDELKRKYLPPSKSEYIGEVKERIRDMEVTLTGARAVSSFYGTSILFTFDYNDNVLVWFTSSPPDDDIVKIGEKYLLTGTVKDHKEYQGVKQTYLNRCKMTLL